MVYSYVELNRELNYAKVAIQSKNSTIEYYKNLAHKREKENDALKNKNEALDKENYAIRMENNEYKHKLGFLNNLKFHYEELKKVNRALTNNNAELKRQNVHQQQYLNCTEHANWGAEIKELERHKIYLHKLCESRGLVIENQNCRLRANRAELTEVHTALLESEAKVKEIEGELNKIIIQAANQGATILKLYQRINGYESYVKQIRENERAVRPYSKEIAYQAYRKGYAECTADINAEVKKANDNCDRLKKIIKGLNEDTKKHYETVALSKFYEDELERASNNVGVLRRDNKNLFNALERNEKQAKTLIQVNQENLETLGKANGRIINLERELSREKKITKDHVALARMGNPALQYLTHLTCFTCGSLASTLVPRGTILRGTITCPECEEKAPDLIELQKELGKLKGELFISESQVKQLIGEGGAEELTSVTVNCIAGLMKANMILQNELEGWKICGGCSNNKTIGGCEKTPLLRSRSFCWGDLYTPEKY